MNLNELKDLVKIGQGAFGHVYKARNDKGQIFAVKYLKFLEDEQGIPASAIRQVTILKNIRDHPNLIKLLDLSYSHHEKVMKLVFDYYDMDLKGYIRSKEQALGVEEIKEILKQILSGICCIHGQSIIHRDIKPQNILIDQDRQVKIIDFGLARFVLPAQKTMSREIETLYYRAPEVMLGEKHYGFAVDMWAVGCIFAELYLKRPLFLAGQHEIEQIHKIFEIMGTPTKVNWPKIQVLSDSSPKFPKWPKQPLSKLFPSMPQAGLDLLERMLEYNDKDRISAKQALEHQFFK